MALPDWAPTLDRVANYVPRRTIVDVTSSGYANATNTFSADTHPPDTVVTQLIADACAWVLAKTGDVDASLADMAAATAAVAVAAAVEQGYPDSRDDLSNGDALYQRAVAMRDDLARANEAITGEDPEDPAAHLMPVYSFPEPPGWGDESFL